MMRVVLIIFCAALIGCSSSSNAQKGQQKSVQPIVLKNLADSAGYALGVDVASSLKSRKMTAINQVLINRAFEERLAGKPSLIDENECFLVLNDYSNQMMNAPDTVAAVEKPVAGSSKKLSKKAGSKSSPVPDSIILRNLADSAGYALGINMANSLLMQDMTGLNRSYTRIAIASVFAGDSSMLRPEHCYGILRNYANQMAREKAAAVIKAGEDFLAENARRPEVKTTASGLQYEILREAEGPKPMVSDIFVAHYSGKLLDGTEFDNSYNRGQPLEMGVSQVVRGWVEGLQLMSKGSKYKFYIPYQLGYGLAGSPPAIPGGSVLIFELELLDIKKQ